MKKYYIITILAIIGAGLFVWAADTHSSQCQLYTITDLNTNKIYQSHYIYSQGGGLRFESLDGVRVGLNNYTWTVELCED